MTEALIVKGRELVGAGIRTDGGYILQDPTDVLIHLRATELSLRKRVLISSDPDIDGALQWCPVKAELLLLAGRQKDAQIVLKMGTEDTIKEFGPRNMVRGDWRLWNG